MAGRKASQKKGRHRRKRIWVLLMAVLLVLAVTGYGYRDYILAAVDNGDPGEGELPRTDAEPDAPGEPEEPAEPGQPGEPGEEIPPIPLPPPGELLHVADGNYLLALVARFTILGSGYAPGDLETIAPEMVNPAQRQWSYYLRREAYVQLRKMWEAARGDGVELLVTSAYRSYGTQGELFRDYASRHGDEKANTFSARPGQSEHQLGTAVDFGGTSADHTPAFAATAAGSWLAEHAHRYGFAMSYAEGTSEITGYIYEPWHFRYIGVEAAAAWKESGLVLVEFLTQQPQLWLD